MHEQQAHPAGGRGKRWALAAVLVLAAIGFYASGLHHTFTLEFVQSRLDEWKTAVREHLLVSLVVFFAMYAATTALSLPTAALLTLLGGFLFGRWLGTGVVSLASTLGATLAFLSSRYILRDWVRSTFAARLGPIDRGVERDGAFYLLTLRLVPAAPFFLVNLGMGLTPMRTTTYAAVSWLGMLPGTFLYVNLGGELETIHSLAGLLSWRVLLSLALLGLAPLVIRRLLPRRPS